jgi:hypothetical protein
VPCSVQLKLQKRAYMRFGTQSLSHIPQSPVFYAPCLCWLLRAALNARRPQAHRSCCRPSVCVRRQAESTLPAVWLRVRVALRRSMAHPGAQAYHAAVCNNVYVVIVQLHRHARGHIGATVAPEGSAGRPLRPARAPWHAAGPSDRNGHQDHVQSACIISDTRAAMAPASTARPRCSCSIVREHFA